MDLHDQSQSRDLPWKASKRHVLRNNVQSLGQIQAANLSVRVSSLQKGNREQPGGGLPARMENHLRLRYEFPWVSLLEAGIYYQRESEL